VTVVATLAGEPVALAQEAASRRLARAEKERIKAERRGEQAVVRPSIEAIGGEVLGTYQSALNGIKVRIPRRQLAALQQVAGVVAVRPVVVYYPANAVGVPRIEAPVAWDAPAGVHGEGIKIAVIDSGIDYTHANFGGPGTPGAFAAAFAASALPADPSLFGLAAPKVKGGYDLVGDDYDPLSADPARGPRPDPNPLDCAADGVGHGTSVAGSAVGFGVTDNGTTYTGPYDATTHSRSFLIGPGVAPKADLYAIRVYGCEGGRRGTSMVVEALEWAIDNDMDVINMSLGNRFSVEFANDLGSEAADNAVRAGIVVLAVAGNEGDVRYVTRSPGSSTRAISVASSSANATNPAATVVAGGTTRLLQNSNAAPFSSASYEVYVLATATGDVSLGCKPNTGSPDDWALPANAANVPGKLVIVQRGVCARIAKAVYGQQHGAAAVLMINTDDLYPPFEGPINHDEDGSPFTVTIPFFGAPASDGLALRHLHGQAATFTPATLPAGLSPFTSSGPRHGDGLLKPDITAPGTAIVSALVGSGVGALTASGTSMATPMVAGTAALVLQAHPGWKPWQVKAAIINSGRPSELADYRARLAGSGLINAAAATLTSTIAFADRQTTTLNFGVQEFSSDFHGSAPIFVQNDGAQDVVFNVSATNPAGSPHTLSLSRTQVHVPAGGEAQVTVRIVIPSATAGGASEFREVAGLVTFTPASPSMNSGYALRVPYYVVPRVSSDVTTTLESQHVDPDQSRVILENRFSPVAGTADFFAWGFESKRAAKMPGEIDLHAVGVQSLANGEIVIFAITTKEAWSSASPLEFDVLIDSNLDGEIDFWIFSYDYGRITTGFFDGRVGTFIVDLTTGERSVYFFADAPTDSSSILLPVPAAAIGITSGNPRFAYTVGTWSADFIHRDHTFDSWAFFNPFTSAISTGAFAVVNPGQRIHVPFTINATEWAATPALGLMVVTQDNRNGTGEANLVRVNVR
jgi:subtilisin family serine protease